MGILSRGTLFSQEEKWEGSLILDGKFHKRGEIPVLKRLSRIKMILYYMVNRNLNTESLRVECSNEP